MKAAAVGVWRCVFEEHLVERWKDTHTCGGVDADGTGDEGLSVVQTDPHLQRSALQTGVNS